MGVHPWPSLTIEDHPPEHLRPSPTRPCFPGDNRRPWIRRCQPCSSHSGSWLVYKLQKLEESPILPLRMSLFHVFSLLILVSSLLGDLPQPWTVTRVCGLPERGVTKTLVFHTCYSCAGTIVVSCTCNHTTYSVWFHDGQCICFNPIYHPLEQWLEVQSFIGTGKISNHT
jgi:hypothetical protein